MEITHPISLLYYFTMLKTHQYMGGIYARYYKGWIINKKAYSNKINKEVKTILKTSVCKTINIVYPKRPHSGYTWPYQANLMTSTSLGGGNFMDDRNELSNLVKGWRDIYFKPQVQRREKLFEGKRIYLINNCFER